MAIYGYLRSICPFLLKFSSHPESNQLTKCSDTNISPSNILCGLNGVIGWPACVSTYPPACTLPMHALRVTGVYHKAMARPVATASQLVMCVGEVSLERGLGRNGLTLA